MKSRKCKSCKTEFKPTRPMQKVCSPECAYQLVKEKAEQERRKESIKERSSVRKRLEAMQTLPQLVKKAQKAFNAFIRARDAGKPCISCGIELTDIGIGWGVDCGHFRSVGSAPNLRFEEKNAHVQCKRCNRYLSGNAIEYRKRLIERIGVAEVERIEADQTVRKYTKDFLVQLASQYRAKTKVLQQQRSKNAVK
jgi:hypothetical protein